MGSNDPFAPVYPPDVPGDVPSSTRPRKVPPNGRPWIYGFVLLAVLAVAALFLRDGNERPTHEVPAAVEPVDAAKPTTSIDTTAITQPDTARPTVH